MGDPRTRRIRPRKRVGYLPNRSTSRVRVGARLCLVVGRITLFELGLRSGLPALHVASAVALWDEFAFAVRIRRDDHSAAGG